MSLSKAQALVTQFYDWEIRGRGWMRAPEAVELEPPFYPFFEHYVPEAYIDDGKRPTILSTFADLFRKNTTPKGYQYEPPEYDVFPFMDDVSLATFSIVFPKHHKLRSESMEHLLLMISKSTYPTSFEVIATAEYIKTQLVCRVSDKPYIYGQIRALFPECIVQEQPLEDLTEPDKLLDIVEYALKEEFMRPIAIPKGYDHDPLLSFYAVLEQLQNEERVVLQILFSGLVNDWSKSVINSVSDGHNGSFFYDAPEMPNLAKEKLTQPLFAVAIRVAVQDYQYDNINRVQALLNTALCTASASNHNSLIPFEDAELEDVLDDVELRQTHRFGMLLNIKELATFAHFPTAIHSHKLVRDAKKTKGAPLSAVGHQYQLGVNVHQGKEVAASISSEQRLRHLHVIGATGTRKSSMLLHLINQDIANGNGCAILDPHGDLIENILPFIPKERIKDVVLIDPNDREHPVAFNILSAHSEVEKEVLASDLVALFKRFSTSWGDQMNSVFANAIIAFLDNTKGGTLLDLRRFLLEKDFREQILSTVTDPDIVYYWRKEFPMLKGGSIASILTRLDTFLRPKLIRNMVSQKKSLNFRALMDSKKIILVKLSEGMIGAENSFLLGAFIVSKIQQAAMARQEFQSSQRTPFYLYIDEFQHFITPSMANMLSGVRKYGLGLILAHQDMAQVAKYDNELAGALLSNAGTRVCFRLGDTDAKRLADGFASFGADDLQNLAPGDAIARVNRSEDDFSLVASSLRATEDKGFADEIISHSRTTYGVAIAKDEPTFEEPNVTKSEAIVKEIPQQPPPLQDKEKLKSFPTPKQQTNHRYTQVLIKKMAEANGYKASIEAPTPDGKGRVDVLLEKDGKTIAVEISKSTEATWEAHNIEKCLRANYTQVFACIDNTTTRKAVIQSLSPLPSNVLIDTVESLVLFLQTATKEKEEKRVKGYRINVQYGANLSADEVNTKRATISSILNSGKKK